jgi:hypothetical protein
MPEGVRTPTQLPPAAPEPSAPVDGAQRIFTFPTAYTMPAAVLAIA